MVSMFFSEIRLNTPSYNKSLSFHITDIEQNNMRRLSINGLEAVKVNLSVCSFISHGCINIGGMAYDKKNQRISMPNSCIKYLI